MAGEQEAVYGKYEGVETRTGNTNGRNWTMYSLLINGRKIGIGFNNKIVADVPVGQNVKLGVSKDAKGYWKVDTIEKVDTLPVESQTEVSRPVQGPGRPEVQLQIVRQTAIKVAADVVNATYADGARKIKAVARIQQTVVLADHLVAYILTGNIDPLNEEQVKKFEEALKD